MLLITCTTPIIYTVAVWETFFSLISQGWPGNTILASCFKIVLAKLELHLPSLANE